MRSIIDGLGKAIGTRARTSGILTGLVALIVALRGPVAGNGGSWLPGTSMPAVDNRAYAASTVQPVHNAQTASERALEPVIIKGSTVSQLLLSPVQQLFVLVYQDSAWKQIPSQVDEVAADGSYLAAGDGVLNASDEIVFMVKDLGAPAPAGPRGSAILPIGGAGYGVEVIDPTDNDTLGWAYVVLSTTLTHDSEADYVHDDPQTRRISTSSYVLGFPLHRAWLDYLALGGGLDILDRTKFFLNCMLPIACPVTEWKTARLDDVLIKDGRVRVIARDGNLLAYESLIDWRKPYQIPGMMTGELRLSTDFSTGAIGATYYNARVPQGIIIDGIPDDVPAQPFSSWWQVSTVTGSLVQVTDFATIGELPRNYYVDDSTPDPGDPGDGSHYGETGLEVSGPNLYASYFIRFYVLPGKQLSVGATYAFLADHPLITLAQPVSNALETYLPYIVR